jgi:prepilin-type N-terminal cleavage/methylation domain-containing protein
MDGAMMTRQNVRQAELDRQSGFTLIEVVISIVILMVGLLSVLAVFGVAMANTQTVQMDQIARQKTMEAVESVYTARQTQQLTFAQIANTPTGIFKTGFQDVLSAGPDGLVGTADDGTGPNPGCPGTYQCVVLPGVDGKMGDAVTYELKNFKRQIQIANVNNPDGTPNLNLKQIIATVQYSNGRTQKTYQVQGLISSFR